jgi:hypothetical protein
MAGSRTLKLSILAETKDLVEGLNSASKETQSFGDKATEFGKKAALAFALAGAAALAFAGDAVRAAAQDQAAQEKLAETIKATTDATASQIKGVEDYITKTSIAVGVADDQLRPAFGRLVRSTKDVDEAQRLLNLALDLSVAASKPVETVANALGKAYDGNFAALNKLGLGLDANILKTKDTEAIVKSLEATYGQFSEGAAETAAVKFERIRIATDEAKESIGAALLPVVEKLADFVLTTVVPNLDSFIKALTGEGSLQEATDNATDGAYQFGQQVRKVITTVIDFKDELIAVGAVIATIFVVSKISAGVTATIALIKTLIVAYNALKASAIVAGVAAAFALNPLLGVGAVALAAGVLAAANALAGQGDGGAGGAPSTGAIPFASGFGTQSVTKVAETNAADAAAFAREKAQAAAQRAQLDANIARTKAQADQTALLAARTAAAVASRNLNDVLASQSGQLPTFNAGAFRAAEAASMGGTTINLTVTGALDREGTARTIIDTLNNSFYRGTGGADNLQLT